MLEVKELAVSANNSAMVDLSHFGEFSQTLMNTSSALSQVNDTLRKTSELITDSAKAGKFALWKCQCLQKQYYYSVLTGI